MHSTACCKNERAAILVPDVATLLCEQAYGKTTFLITNLSKVPRGTEGAISLEGTAAGATAALGFSAVAIGLGQVGWQLLHARQQGDRFLARRLYALTLDA